MKPCLFWGGADLLTGVVCDGNSSLSGLVLYLEGFFKEELAERFLSITACRWRLWLVLVAEIEALEPAGC